MRQSIEGFILDIVRPASFGVGFRYIWAKVRTSAGRDESVEEIEAVLQDLAASGMIVEVARGIYATEAR